MNNKIKAAIITILIFIGFAIIMTLLHFGIIPQEIFSFTILIISSIGIIIGFYLIILNLIKLNEMQND